ncbi:hypothetical protein DPMN_001332 [Dreissena polymorpha]|uniref:ETS domain-containing protein n=2 Tax=Dreissena polymorpha TaxID=45954 RepID=A0A9D4MJV1_DREPO|nr:hypothetical protein DPMN_001332 [Dreissena polymorpha]
MSECSDSNMDTCRQSQYPGERNGSCGSEIFTDDEMSSLLVSDDMKKVTSPKRKAVQKRKQKSGEPTKPQNRGRKPGQISKGNHLWEFIRDLLKDSKYNPHLLRWEEKETGVFRFVQSEAVAQMWGRKKNNPGMTYEKLSRAMRFCRTAGYFAEVPKNRQISKEIVLSVWIESNWLGGINNLDFGGFRYYYKRGILDRVDGRRLVYKFGINSHGWK